MRTRKTSRSDRGWASWAVGGPTAGRLPKSVGHAEVERLESRRLLTAPHFVRTGAELVGTDLVVSFKEAGLGNNQTVTIQASALVTVTYAAINNGGNHPQAAKFTSFESLVTVSGDFTSGKNGTVNATLTISPPPPPADFGTPGINEVVLVEATYSNLSVTDTTNDATETIDGTFEYINPDFVDLGPGKKK